MRQLSKKYAPYVCLGLILCFVSPVAWATDQITVSKVFVGNNTYLEITNTGTLNALGRIFNSTRMPSSVKAEPMTEILGGAAAAGSLNPTTIVSGDWFYALDENGEPIIVQFTNSEFVIPNGSTSVFEWSIPH